MGYNSTIMVCNDTLRSIEKDPDFGKKIADGISRCTWNGPINIGYNAQVLETHHADGNRVIIVGGNTGIVTKASFFVGGYMEEDKILLGCLRAFADELGYTLRRKPQRK